MYKKYIVPVLLLLAIFSYAGPLDRPAATVNLIKPQLISHAQLSKRVEDIQKLSAMTGVQTGIQSREQVLDAMIAELLIMQAAERDKITVSQPDINSYVQQQKASVEMQLQAAGQLPSGSVITDVQFREIIKKESGLTYEQYIEQIKKQILQQRYIAHAKRPLFDAVKSPTEKEIREQYDVHQSQFVNPRMLRFSHIYFSTVNLSDAEKKKALERAEEAHKKLNQGESFDSLTATYSDDTRSRYNGGDFGYLGINDRRAAAYLGESFFNKLFTMEKGEIAGVLTSNLGYHIVKLTDKRDPVFLGLDDQLSPVNSMTVRQYIVSSIMQQKEQITLQKAYSELVTELTKQADIQRFPEE